MSILKYCVNCESPIPNYDPTQNGITDFCSPECADEYLSNADERVLLVAREANPDALPISSEIDRPAIKFPRTNTGQLPPSTLEAVQSLLHIGGVSKEAIDNVININKTNSKELTPNAQPFVNNNFQKEPNDGNS